VALTVLGFDTRGSDGVFGPRSREMIARLAACAQPARHGLSVWRTAGELVREASVETARKPADQQPVTKKGPKAEDTRPACRPMTRVVKIYFTTPN